MSRVLPDGPANILQQSLVQSMQLIHVAEQPLYNLIREGLVMASLLPHLWQQGLQHTASAVDKCTDRHTDTQTCRHNV